MSQNYSLYRYDNGEGTSKDWAIMAGPDANTFTTRWGKTSYRLPQVSTRPLPRGKTIYDIMHEKIRKGYLLVGRVMIDEDGFLVSQPAEPILPATPSHCYWRVRSIQWTMGLEARIGEVLSILRQHFPESGWLKCFDVDNAPTVGILTREDGIGPLLLFLALKSSTDIQVSLSHEDGVEITHQLKNEGQTLAFFGVTLADIRSVAEELGLLQKRIDISQLPTGQMNCVYF